MDWHWPWRMTRLRTRDTARYGLLLLAFNIGMIPIVEGVITCPTGWTRVGLGGDRTMCAHASDGKLRWRDAVTYCEMKNARLDITVNESTRILVESNAEQLDRDEIWMNAKNGPRIWTWDQNKVPLHNQGCWKDDPNNPDLPLVAAIPAYSPENCVAACRGMGAAYTAASLQMNTTQGGFVCRCGRSFGKYERVSMTECQVPCPENFIGGNPSFCGGKLRQLVFAVIRSPQLLHVEYEYLGLELGECGAFVYQDPVQWVQMPCDRKLPFICEKRAGDSDCETKVASLNTCITLHTMASTWHQARATCLNEGARLLQLNKPIRPQDLGWRPGDGQPLKWWIGASIWNWRSAPEGSANVGDPLPAYDGWATGQPLYSDERELCIQGKEDHDYRWSVAKCRESKYFYCLGPASSVLPIIVAPSTDPSPTPMSGHALSDPPLTDPPPTGTTTPQQGVDKTIIVGAIGAGVGVGFVLVLICIVLACRKCTNRSRDSKRDSVNSGAARRLPSIPRKKRTQRYHSSPAKVLSKMSPDGKEDEEDVEGDYDYIDLDETAGPLKDPEDGVTYEVLMVVEGGKDKDKPHEYAGLDGTYIIPIEPPQDGVKSPKEKEKQRIDKEKAEKERMNKEKGGDKDNKENNGDNPPAETHVENEKQEKSDKRSSDVEKISTSGEVESTKPEGKAMTDEEAAAEIDATYSIIYKNKPSRDSAIEIHPTGDSTNEDNPPRDSTTEDKSSRNSAAEDQTSRNSAAEDKSSRNSVAEDKSSRNSVAEDKSSRNSAVEDKSSRNSAAEDKSSRNSVAEDKSSRNSAAEDKSSRNSVAEDKSSRNSSAEDKPSRSSTIEDNSSRNSTAGISQPD